MDTHLSYKWNDATNHSIDRTNTCFWNDLSNTYGVPIVLYATALLTPSSSAPYYFGAFLGPSAGSLQSVLQAVTPAGGGQHGYPVTLKVPAWYYSFSFTGTGTGASGGRDGKVCVYHDK